MCIKKVDAYLDSKGGLHRGEMAALLNEVHIVTGFKPDMIAAIRSTAAALLPLLKRVAELDAPKSKEDPAAAETVDPSSGGVLDRDSGRAHDERKLTEAEIETGGHAPTCRTWDTGYLSDCNCADDLV